MNSIVTKLKEISMILDTTELAKIGADYMRSITPIKTRNARTHTIASGNEIKASYPYAARLDEGYSKQNTTGLIEPTLKYLDTYIQNKAK